MEAGRRLTQHLLRFAGRHTTRPERQHLVSTLPDLQELLGIVVGKRIEVTVKVAPDTWPVVVDTSELELALLNLALNARDAMPQGGHLWIEAGNATPDDTADLPPGSKTITIIDGSSGKSKDVVIPGTGKPGEKSARNVPPAEPRLLESSRHGAIPKIAGDGAKAYTVYAQPRPLPASLKDMPRIAIVIGGLGISASGTADLLTYYPPPVKDWIRRKGGLTPKMKHLKNGVELWDILNPCPEEF